LTAPILDEIGKYVLLLLSWRFFYHICGLYPFTFLGHSGLDHLKDLKAKLCDMLFNAEWLKILHEARERERERERESPQRHEHICDVFKNCW
jgi:hypothetical protein